MLWYCLLYVFHLVYYVLGSLFTLLVHVLISLRLYVMASPSHLKLYTKIVYTIFISRSLISILFASGGWVRMTYVFSNKLWGQSSKWKLGYCMNTW